MEIENSHQLVQLLARQLVPEEQENPKALQSLQDAFSLIGFDNISHFDLSNISDFLDISTIEPGGQQTLSQPVTNDNFVEQFHVFARTTPVRSSQVEGGSNPFLSGTSANTVGPFTINLRPPFWLDFIRTQRSVALFVQGNPIPVLYFKIIVNILPGRIFTIPKLNTYNIIPSSVWVQAKMLHAFAPADLYAGLKVSSGTLSISGNFTTNQTGIILSPQASFACRLQLVQKELPADEPGGLYGKDARDLSIQLPVEFSFTSTGIEKVGGANATVFGNALTAAENTLANTKYFEQQKRLGISLNLTGDPVFNVTQTQSPLLDIHGQAAINNVWWALPLSQILLMQPLEAEGNGALMVECAGGLSANIKKTGGDEISLPKPQFLIEPGRINMTDIASNGAGKTHTFSLWKDQEKQFGTETSIRFLKEALFVYNTLAEGNELISSFAGFNIDADRPVNIKGEAVALRSDKGGILIGANEQNTIISISDFELLINKNAGPNDLLPVPQKMALALSNAMLTTTLPASAALLAFVSDDLKSLTKGTLEITFGLYAYLPTLPDPYVANLGIMRRQLERIVDAPDVVNRRIAGTEVWMWVVARVSWGNEDMLVNTAFELQDFDQSRIVNNYRLPFPMPASTEIAAKKSLFVPMELPPPGREPGSDFKEKLINRSNDAQPGMENYKEDVTPVFVDFALLDVSSNANQMGVAFSHKFPYLQQLAGNDNNQDGNENIFPIKIEGLSIITGGKNAQAFTLPGIAWEPLLNISDTGPDDPRPGFNYFPNDGLPTVMGNLSNEPVVLAPIPLVKHLVDTFKSNKDGKTYALFNLPFGMVAFAILNQNKATQTTKPAIENVLPEFENAIIGGIQLELTAGSSFDNDNGQGLFEGYTFQLVNLYDQLGKPAKSTLGKTPTEIFNNEFTAGTLSNRPGVPVAGVGISGYGTSMASKWANDDAMFAQVSKAEFNVFTGRTSHELVQVVSKEHPFGAKFIRTITIFRMSNGYVIRVDSGWKAQTPGLYDFSYINDVTRKKEISPFNFHPGIVKGTFNIRNIKEVQKPPFKIGLTELQAVTYDADILLDNITEGGKEQELDGNKVILVPSTGILGYIQIAPAGFPIDKNIFVQLLQSEGGSIGGSINCVIKIAGTDQHKKLNRFDVSPSVDTGGRPVFVSTGRGSVFLPKDGSWSLVQHKIGNGNVTPLPAQFSVPLIKEGLRPGFDAVTGKDLYNPFADFAPDALHRIADPANLLVIDPTGNNYGFLQNMGSQKVLFLT
ncbi:MAG: hypothetical protein ABI707_17415, partial [Ferruginibacter sp.]